MEPNNSKKRKHLSKSLKLNKVKKFKKSSYNCGKLNHIAKDFHVPKKKNQSQVHMTEVKTIPVDLSELDLLAILFEANLMDNPR